MTRSLVERIEAAEAAPGTVKMFWLLQAGFAFKSMKGTTLLVDPYLSNEVEVILGVRREVPPPIDPASTRADAILATHWHPDHLDPQSILPLAAASSAVFVGPPSCDGRVVGRGVRKERSVALNRGETTQIKDVKITATFARHEVPGWWTEDAVGFMLDFDGLRIYHSGDTEYDARLVALRNERIDVAAICMNGTGGNMNAYEAALLAWQIDAKTVVPMHFGLWFAEGYGPGATLNPEVFMSTYRKLGGQGKVIVPKLGEEVTLQKEG